MNNLDKSRFSSQMPSMGMALNPLHSNFDNRSYDTSNIQKAVVQHKSNLAYSQNVPQGITQPSEGKRSFNKTILEQHQDFINENQKLEEQSNQTVNNQYPDQEKADAGNSPLKPSMLESAITDNFE